MFDKHGQLKVSIITAVYNATSTIEECIRSIRGQTHPSIEYIVIDGDSDDGTNETLQQYREHIDQYISEPDDGIFDAMNKGIELATGDVVGILNADDFYADERVIRRVSDTLEERDVASVYGDLVYVDKDSPEEIVRYWRAGYYERGRFRWGWMPPHPTVFFRRELYEEYGTFDPTLDVSADYELCLRFLYRHGASAAYLPEVLVHMRTGGNSNASLSQRVKGHLQDYQSWFRNRLVPNPIGMTLKPLSKLPQYLLRPE
jgi:glycosyltransferase involved in cell wall biosynthesis